LPSTNRATQRATSLLTYWREKPCRRSYSACVINIRQPRNEIAIFADPAG
jgi:hypothetical protein